MRAVLAAATGLPTILLTAALVVVVCFWLLAAVGVVGVTSFDTDVDVRAWDVSGVPVTVAFSLLAVLAWSLGVGAAVVLHVLAPPAPADELLRMIAPVGALLVAWVMTCWIVGLWRRFLLDETALSRMREVRTGDDAGSRKAGEAA
ncbi:hypothetical protein [Streptomyces griseoluteus]|uniref:hypothetical protein n=1 Tax=Streptomyces griseoluteus TaxID=29306 RepID=UPI0036839550